MGRAAYPLAGLTGEELLHAWECAAPARPLLRGAALLEAVLPELPCAAASLPLGARDTLLLALRVGTFGNALSAVAECSSCAESADVEVDAAALLAGLPEVEFAIAADAVPERLVVGDLVVSFRLPTTLDVLAAAEAPDARTELAARCVLGPSPGKDVLTAVAERMAAADPAADLHLRLHCPSCAQPWLAPFDVAAFVWTEVAAAATGLLVEVDLLAARYGWSEQAILAMTPTRRRAYLDLP